MASSPAKNTRSRSSSPTKLESSFSRRKLAVSPSRTRASSPKKEKAANGGITGVGNGTSQSPRKGSKAVRKMSNARTSEIDEHHEFEFGGSLGCACMMLFFPCVMYYLWASMVFYNGRLALPTYWTPRHIRSLIFDLYGHIKYHALPNTRAFYIYEGLMGYQVILALLLPGIKSKGLPLPSLQNQRLDYYCNALAAWYVTLGTGFVLHTSGIFRMTEIIDNFGSIMTVAILTGFGVSALTYIATVAKGQGHRMSGHLIYDFFMGAPLNPRITPPASLQKYLNKIDIKMFFEVRVPWVLLFGIAVSAACKQYEQYGYLSPNLAFMVLATALYMNACAKGEELIPQTWDMFYEKFGFMLCFWNLAGVPFTYSYSILYLASQDPEKYRFSQPAYYGLYIALLIGYYIFDTANAQKSRLRMAWAGTPIQDRKWAFPQLPWSTLDPKTVSYIQTKQGNKILTGGWWGVVRKPAYTGDLIQSLCWGLCTGLPWNSSLICYYYFAFFVAVLSHRVSRDHQRCKEKYGSDWEAYCRQVPYSFIPGII